MPEMVEPLVSVIMPFYNAAKFLAAAVKSVLKQDFTDFELLLINDGSTDASETIAKSFNDPRIRYFVKPNSGVADTLNFALSHVNGKYIYRHDADDISLPGKLSNQVAFLEEHSEFALCATQITFMTERGFVAWNYRQPRNAYFNEKDFVEVKREHFNPYSPITHATVLIRTEVMNELGGYRTAFKTAEDVDLWLRLLNKYSAVVLNQCNYFVRLNRTSATQVQGWKNAFFRNLAFTYYDQRGNSGQDDLQKGFEIVMPAGPAQSIKKENSDKGRLMRQDLLDFIYPLHLNAKDWKTCVGIVKVSLRDGWKLNSTWKAIVLPIMGKNLVRISLRVKKHLS